MDSESKLDPPPSEIEIESTLDKIDRIGRRLRKMAKYNDPLQIPRLKDSIRLLTGTLQRMKKYQDVKKVYEEGKEEAVDIAKTAEKIEDELQMMRPRVQREDLDHKVIHLPQINPLGYTLQLDVLDESYAQLAKNLAFLQKSTPDLTVHDYTEINAVLEEALQEHRTIIRDYQIGIQRIQEAIRMGFQKPDLIKNQIPGTGAQSVLINHQYPEIKNMARQTREKKQKARQLSLEKQTMELQIGDLQDKIKRLNAKTFPWSSYVQQYYHLIKMDQEQQQVAEQFAQLKVQSKDQQIATEILEAYQGETENLKTKIESETQTQLNALAGSLPDWWKTSRLQEWQNQKEAWIRFQEKLPVEINGTLDLLQEKINRTRTIKHEDDTIQYDFLMYFWRKIEPEIKANLPTVTSAVPKSHPSVETQWNTHAKQVTKWIQGESKAGEEESKEDPKKLDIVTRLQKWVPRIRKSSSGEDEIIDYTQQGELQLLVDRLEEELGKLMDRLKGFSKDTVASNNSILSVLKALMTEILKFKYLFPDNKTSRSVIFWSGGSGVAKSIRVGRIMIGTLTLPEYVNRGQKQNIFTRTLQSALEKWFLLPQLREHLMEFKKAPREEAIARLQQPLLRILATPISIPGELLEELPEDMGSYLPQRYYQLLDWITDHTELDWVTWTKLLNPKEGIPEDHLTFRSELRIWATWLNQLLNKAEEGGLDISSRNLGDFWVQVQREIQEGITRKIIGAYKNVRAPQQIKLARSLKYHQTQFEITTRTILEIVSRLADHYQKFQSNNPNFPLLEPTWRELSQTPQLEVSQIQQLLTTGPFHETVRARWEKELETSDLGMYHMMNKLELAVGEIKASDASVWTDLKQIDKWSFPVGFENTLRQHFLGTLIESDTIESNLSSWGVTVESTETKEGGTDEGEVDGKNKEDGSIIDVFLKRPVQIEGEIHTVYTDFLKAQNENWSKQIEKLKQEVEALEATLNTLNIQIDSSSEITITGKYETDIWKIVQDLLTVNQQITQGSDPIKTIYDLSQILEVGKTSTRENIVDSDEFFERMRISSGLAGGAYEEMVNTQVEAITQGSQNLVAMGLKLDTLKSLMKQAHYVIREYNLMNHRGLVVILSRYLSQWWYFSLEPERKNFTNLLNRTKITNWINKWNKLISSNHPSFTPWRRTLFQPAFEQALISLRPFQSLLRDKKATRSSSPRNTILELHVQEEDYPTLIWYYYLDQLANSFKESRE